jgi:ferrous-iron efflux pump FieF
VRGFHKLRTRRSGGHRYVDVHVMLSDSLGLVEAHEITEALEDRAREQIPNLEITIHTEPYETELLHQKSDHSPKK